MITIFLVLLTINHFHIISCDMFENCLKFYLKMKRTCTLINNAFVPQLPNVFYQANRLKTEHEEYLPSLCPSTLWQHKEFLMSPLFFLWSLRNWQIHQELKQYFMEFQSIISVPFLRCFGSIVWNFGVRRSNSSSPLGNYSASMEMLVVCWMSQLRGKGRW